MYAAPSPRAPELSEPLLLTDIGTGIEFPHRAMLQSASSPQLAENRP